ncbi:CHAT domain-containing protein [Cellulomonas sp. H30R-01]|uniref:CHAT domain-containing protein n=1 Tax=Cellulomonas sp. H30R-01 TaxID=2704467 RepID=UPI00138CE5C7|nr:CHAT domain-containing protein [Cellulomonas sp. H30R-01]QHT57440.1 CHAT domain-containing protein [Cellulomonas sp. H30R-01]
MTTSLDDPPAGAPPGADRAVVDVDVRVVPDGDTYLAVVSCDAFGTSTTRPFTPPVAADVTAFADALADARGRTRPDADAARALTERTETLGRALFDAVFADDARDLLVTARDRAGRDGGAVRVRLQLDDAPDVAALPWELLLHGSTYLVHTDGVFVVRYPDASTPADPAPLDGTLRVLVVAASPSDLPPLDVDREVDALREALAPLGDRVELHRLAPPTLDALRRTLDDRWHVLHVVGHGGADARGGVLALTADDGTADVLDARTLADHLLAAPHLRVAVLNGCSTGEVSTQEPKAGSAHQLVRAGVPVAVAMQYPVTDRSAHAAAAALYERLAAGALVEQAVTAARRALLRGPEWVTPVLYTRTSPRVFVPPAASPGTPVAAVPPRDRVPTGVVPDVLQPRWWAVREVAAWMDSPSTALLVTGDVGSGTSVLAGWLAGAGTTPAEPDAPVDLLESVRSRWSAVHVSPPGGGGAGVDPRSVVRSLAEQLATTVPGWQPVRADAAGPYGLAHLPPEELFAVLVGQPLRAALTVAPQGTTVRVLVDGLDHDGLDPVLRLAAVPGVRVLVAGTDPAVATALDAVSAARLDLASPHRRALVDADLTGYLRRRLDGSGRGDDEVAALVARAGGNFLVARNAADELLARPDVALEDLELPRDVDASSERHLRATLEQSFGPTWRDQWAAALEPLLAHLAVARGPVPLPALVRWLGSTLPRVAALVDGLGGLVVTDADGCRLAHSSLVATLRAATLPSGGPNLLRVDEAAAHRRVVGGAVALTATDLAHPDDVGASYPLVHAPGHLLELPHDDGVAPPAPAGPDPRREVRLDARRALGDRALEPDWVGALTASVHDPLLLGLPYRDLVALHLRAGDTGAVERVVRFLGTSDVPLLRGAVFDVLSTYAERSPAAATAFLVRVAVHDAPELQRIALHATCLLPAAAQADVYAGVVTDPDSTDAHAVAAAFALYSNGTSDPQRLIGDVLDRVVGRLHVFPPRRSTWPLVTFFSQVTVTNYVNGCADPAVVDATSRLWRHVLVDRIGVLRPWGPLVQRLVVEGVVARRIARRVLLLFTPPGRPDGPVELGGDRPEAPAARRVLAGLDPHADVGTLTPDLRALLASDTTMFRVLAALVVAVHGLADPTGTDALVTALADGADARTQRALLVAHAVVAPDRTPASWVPRLDRLTRLVTARPHDEHAAAGPLGGRHLVFVPLGLACAGTGTSLDVLDEWLRPDADPGWRSCCLRGLGAVGLYHPDAVLGTFERLDRAGTLPLDAAVPSLALMAGLHPMRTRTWLLRAGRRDVLDAVFGAADPADSREHLELLGMYNAAVHGCVTSPRVRDRVVTEMFAGFLDCRTGREWSRRFGSAGVRALREDDWELAAWTS